MKNRIFLSVIVAAGLFSSCDREPVSAVPEGMTLVWSDEFDRDGAPDPEKWVYSTGGNGWGNGELQFYTDKRENSIVKDGKLILTAQSENGLWTSARLKTQHKGDWTYGFFEIRAKVPRGRGTWPAIWMLPTFMKYGNWPRSGEIDIMEHVGFEPDIIHTSVHTNAYNHKIGTHKTAHDTVRGATKKFQTYAMEWDPDYIQWYINGEPFYRFDNPHISNAEWPFDIPFYLILNLAIGGTWGGQQGIDEKMEKAEMIVDYVRVYQKN